MTTGVKKTNGHKHKYTKTEEMNILQGLGINTDQKPLVKICRGHKVELKGRATAIDLKKVLVKVRPMDGSEAQWFKPSRIDIDT